MPSVKKYTFNVYTIAPVGVDCFLRNKQVLFGHVCAQYILGAYMLDCAQTGIKTDPENRSESMRPGVLVHLCIVGLLMVVTSGHPLFAQVLYGTLTGTVTDTTGAVVPGAKITAVETATGVSHEVQANSEGIYTFSNLNPGTYQVTISAPNFSPKQENGIHLLSNTTDRVDMQLSVGLVSENVEVPEILSSCRCNRPLQPEERQY